MVGVSRAGARTEEDKLKHAIREVLNPVAPRVMAVLDPLKMVITNWSQDRTEALEAPYFPPDVGREGSRTVPFGRELWIERSDFEEHPPKGFRRLVPGGEVRLRYAYVVRCHDVVKDADGRVVELHCTYDPETHGGSTPDGRKVKGTIQWVSAEHGLDAEMRLFAPLLVDEGGAPASTGPADPTDGLDDDPDPPSILDRVNPDSRTVHASAKIEPSVSDDPAGTRYQFERTGYFWRDPVDGSGDVLVFNRIVGLKSGWKPTAKAMGRGGARAEPEVVRAGPAPRARPQVGEERSRARAADPVLTARFERYRTELGLSEEHADLLTANGAAGDFFEAALAEHADVAAVAAWVVTDVRGVLEGRGIDELPFDGAALGRLSRLVGDGVLSRRAAKEVMARMAVEGGEPAALVEAMGLAALSDRTELGAVVDDVLSAWPDKVAEYRGGRTQLVGLFVGEVMKATRGAADPKAVRSLLSERLDP
jgi:glutaminyl-tRNA synthetase